MSDRFYRSVKLISAPLFRASASPVVIGLEHIPAAGACIIAANHTSPYDVPILISRVPRPVDFVSITEVFKNPAVGWFYGSMNAFPLERSRPDAPAVRTILGRLGQGRAVGMFPEGGFRRGDASVVNTGKIRPGVGRIARLSGAPVVPAVIVNSAAYSRPGSWLPIGRTNFGLAFDRVIAPDLDPAMIEAKLVESLMRLFQTLRERLPEGCRTL